MDNQDSSKQVNHLHMAAEDALKGLGAVAHVRSDGTVWAALVPGSSTDLASVAAALELAGLRVAVDGNALSVIRAEIRIDSLLLDPIDDAARLGHLDGKRIRHLVKHPQEIRNILVYENPESHERVIVDGRHRVQAARALGRETIDADVQPGIRHDATRYWDLTHTAWETLHPDCDC